MNTVIQKLNSIDRKVTLLTKQKEYITPDEVGKRYGLSMETLRKYRAAGRLVDVRRSIGGRKFIYSVDELEGMFR